MCQGQGLHSFLYQWFWEEILIQKLPGSRPVTKMRGRGNTAVSVPGGKGAAAALFSLALVLWNVAQQGQGFYYFRESEN